MSYQQGSQQRNVTQAPSATCRVNYVGCIAVWSGMADRPRSETAKMKGHERPRGVHVIQRGEVNIFFYIL